MKTKFELTEQDYRYLFDNASDAMWVHDMEGNFLDANKAFERLSGKVRRAYQSPLQLGHQPLTTSGR